MSAAPTRVARPRLAVGLLAAPGLDCRHVGGDAARRLRQTVTQSALNACAIIAADAERLACYDQLAGRAAQACHRRGSLAGRCAAAEPPQHRRSAPLPAAPSQRAVPPPRETFGLYEAEHPKPPPAAVPPSLEARVVALGTSAGGRMTVSLEGGAVWELDDADPLLAVGDMVTITRAAFGSYLMQTPTRRTHRARRLH